MIRGLFLFALAACGDDQDPGGAAELWNRIHAEDYRSWRSGPGFEAPRPSGAPHSDMTQIWVNDTVAVALDGPSIDAWPDGSLIVKDGTSDGELDLVAVMEKRAGVWYWAEYSEDGTSIYSGAPSLCTDCHRIGADYVRAFPLP
jgi:hypothetical protein